MKKTNLSNTNVNGMKSDSASSHPCFPCVIPIIKNSDSQQVNGVLSNMFST